MHHKGEKERGEEGRDEEMRRAGNMKGEERRGTSEVRGDEEKRRRGRGDGSVGETFVDMHVQH